VSVDYKIKAYPTLYKGRLYRSRLEARWAAFFDLLGFAPEYEPLDLGAWSPDFLVSRPGGFPAYVEVKPISEFDRDVASRMERACDETDTWQVGLLLVGIAPKLCGRRVDIGHYCDFESIAVGEPQWRPAGVGWFSHHGKPGFTPDIVAVSLGGRLYGGLSGAQGEPLPAPEHTMALWAHATNAVQYRSPAPAQ
jgi:hypothetical protein